MKIDRISHFRKLTEQYAYNSLQLHEAAARKAGLSGTDHKYLGFLIQKGQMTAGELAQLTGLTTGAVTGLIDRFEKKQLVKRKFAEDDRRKVIIEPHTEAIVALLEPLYKDYRSQSEALIASFSPDEITVIESYFQKAIALMQETTATMNHPTETFYHGTKADLKNGDLIEPGFSSNYGQRNKAKYVYLTATLDAATWGAELAVGEGRGRIYIVEPTGDYEDDPNLTDKKFPGNPTKSYRTKSGLRVIGEVKDWKGHTPEQLQTMKDSLEKLKAQGIEAIED